MPVIIRDTHYIRETKNRKQNSTRQLTSEDQRQQRHRHHSCAMYSCFGHPDKNRYQKEKQKFIAGECEIEELDQDVTLRRKILWIWKFENERSLQFIVYVGAAWCQ